jgi:hypothetical protein
MNTEGRGKGPCNTGWTPLESVRLGREEPAMGQLWEILFKPDNIPITLLLISVLICLYVALKQAFKNDRLIEEGREDEIYDEMIK